VSAFESEMPDLNAVSSSRWRALSPLDARVLRAVDPWYVLTAARIATRAGCSEELARSSLKRLRKRLLIEPDGSRPTGWQRTHHGDVVLEHQP